TPPHSRHCDRASGGLGLARPGNGPHGPCRAPAVIRESSTVGMTDLLDRISALLDGQTRDLDEIEGTLTDGYAKALSLEAESWRLERRVAVLSQEIEQGDILTNARELAAVARGLERNGEDLAELRRLLAALRRCADDARVGSPTRSSHPDRTAWTAA